jgi:hypothetical protein
MKPRYSGRKSTKFWKRINALPKSKRDEAYSLGVVLQELESTVLRLLKNLKA